MSRTSSRSSSVTSPALDDVEPEETEIAELIALAKANLEGGDASATAAVAAEVGSPSALAWAADPRVARRYLRAAAASNTPGVANALPLLTTTARWRDEMAVEKMESDEALKRFEEDSRCLLWYTLAQTVPALGGRPLLIERVGRWNSTELTAVAKASREDLIRAHVLVSERIRAIVDAPPAPPPSGAPWEVAPPAWEGDRRAVCIFDIDGLGMGLMTATALMGVFKEFSRMDTAHFPDTIGTIFVVNSSMVFTALWKIASVFVTAGTKQKIQVFSWNNRDAMLEAVRASCGADVLPAEIGGVIEGAAPYNELLEA